MISSAAVSNSNHRPVPAGSETLPAGTEPRILVYVDGSDIANRVVTHAMAIAEALHAPLTLLRVLEVAPPSEAPPDPVEWGIRRREAHDHVRRIARNWHARTDRMDIQVVEGKPVEQICLCAREHDVGLTVVGTHRDEPAVEWEFGDTARRLVERGSGALLLVPSSVPDVPQVSYRRLLVPLDGSCRAESVLPLATRLAKAEGAEVLLAHVIPEPELTETGPLEAEDHKLREQLHRRNERVARQYLDRIQDRLTRNGIAARSLIVSDGDVRGSLARIVAEQDVDMLVISSHGRSGRPDVACGSVAAYMLSHAAKPLLIVLRPPAEARDSALARASNGRLPSRSAL